MDEIKVVRCPEADEYKKDQPDHVEKIDSDNAPGHADGLLRRACRISQNTCEKDENGKEPGTFHNDLD